MTIIEETFSLEGVLVNRTFSNDDGTGLWEAYDETGAVVDSEILSGLPIPEVIPEIASLTNAEISLRMREAFDSVATGSLTVSKLKLAMQAAIDALGVTE